MKLDETSWGETSIHGYLWKTEEDDEPSDVGTMLGQLFEDKQSSLEIGGIWFSCSSPVPTTEPWPPGLQGPILQNVPEKLCWGLIFHGGVE